MSRRKDEAQATVNDAIVRHTERDLEASSYKVRAEAAMKLIYLRAIDEVAVTDDRARRWSMVRSYAELMVHLGIMQVGDEPEARSPEGREFELKFLLMLIGRLVEFETGKRAERMAMMVDLTYRGRRDRLEMGTLLVRHGSGWPDEFDEERLIWFYGSASKLDDIAGAGLTTAGWRAYRRVAGGHDLTIEDDEFDEFDDEDEDEDE